MLTRYNFFVQLTLFRYNCCAIQVHGIYIHYYPSVHNCPNRIAVSTRHSHCRDLGSTPSWGKLLYSLFVSVLFLSITYFSMLPLYFFLSVLFKKEGTQILG